MELLEGEARMFETKTNVLNWISKEKCLQV